MRTDGKYCVEPKTEEMIFRIKERLLDNKTGKPGKCRTQNFSNTNPMDPDEI